MAALWFAPQVRAQNVAAADTLFEEGRADLERGDVNAACPKFRESDRLDPANGTKFNLADCEEKRGRVATAWELYRKLSDSFPANDERLPYAKERATALASRVPHVVIKLAQGAPTDTQASFGTRVLTSASFGIAVPLDPGDQKIIISSGAKSRTYSMKLAEGERKVLEVTPEGDYSPAGTSVPTNADRAPSSRGSYRTLAYAAGGVGAAGFLIWTATGLAALHKESVGNDNCSDALMRCNQTGFDANNSARSLATASTVGFVVGVIGLGTGTYFFLASNSDKSVAVGARANGASASLSVDGKW